jgi:hypothetical protein
MVEKTLQWVVWSAMTLLILRANYSMLKKNGLRKALGGYLKLRPINFILGIPVAALVLLSSWFMLSHSDFLAWGWWGMVGGSGNPAIGSNTLMSPILRIPFQFGMIIFTLLILPILADLEEDMFRKGAESWGPTKCLFKAFVFGMVHCLMGVPIGAGIAITVSGLYYTAVYRREFNKTKSQERSLVASSSAHLAYNILIISLLLTLLTMIAHRHLHQ